MSSESILTTEEKNEKSNLDKIKELCKKFIKDDNFVYKASQNIVSKTDKTRKWIIVLKKSPETKTNEDRDDIFDEKYSKYRADKLEVILIINMITLKTNKTFVVNEFKGHIIKYEVGKIVECDKYDDSTKDYLSRGIHYFKSLDGAYYFGKVPSKFIGKWYMWYDNGRLLCEFYIDNEKILKWSDWYSNGKKKSEGCFVNYKKHGKWNTWNENNEQMVEEYLEGVLIAKWLVWNDKYNVNGFNEKELV